MKRFLVLIVGCAAGIALAQEPGTRSVWQGVYTTAQSERGRAIYQSSCAQCHGETLGGDIAPTLTGPFWSIWEGRTAADLFKAIRTTMPADAPDSLKPAEYTDIVAYLFSVNKFPAGSAEMAASPEVLESIRIEAEKLRN
jgi:alcohol dehydrogenase (cytochrome c)